MGEKFKDRAQPKHSKGNEHDTGQYGRDNQPVNAVFLYNSVNNKNESREFNHFNLKKIAYVLSM